MAYIGNKPTVGNFQICDAISVVNGQAAYTMQVGSVNVIPQSANHMIVSLNGTIQKPNSSFTVSGSTITFASNLVTNDVIDFIQILGDVLDLGVPSDATVTAAKLGANSVTAAKLNNDIISGSTELASEPADTDEFLVSDAGTLKRIDYSLIKGAAGLNKIVTNTESSGHDYINIDSCFTSTYENYLIVGTANITYGNTNIGIRMRAGGSTATGSLYSRNIAAMFASSYSDAAGQSYIAMSYNDLITANANWFFYVYAPQLAKTTYVSGMMTSANLHSTSFSGYVATTAQYDGIQIYNANTGAGDLNTSKVTVYGLAI